jgi:hypothetical protein
VDVLYVVQKMNVAPKWYLLRDALFAEDLRTASTLIEDNPELLRERNGIGETVCHFSAVENSLPGIEWLHARGSSLDTKNKFGTPLIFEVAQLGYRDLYLKLQDMGVDAMQTDDLGRSLSEYLREFDAVAMAEFVETSREP